MTAVGFIGTGDMGGPMATHLVEAGHEVAVFDRSDAAMDRVVEAGATPAADASQAASGAAVVFLSLPTPTDVETVVESIADSLEPGSILVDTTTSRPELTNRIADRLESMGVQVLGGPVSGGKAGAQAGTLTIMLGGDTAAVEKCTPVCEAFAADVVHVGPDPGHGHAMKLINNFLSATALVATAEGIVLGQRAGLDPMTMIEVLNASSGRSSATEVKLPDHILSGDYDTGFPLRLLEKDIRLYTEFGESADAPLLLGGVIRNLVGYARSDQGDDADLTRVYDFIEHVMTR